MRAARLEEQDCEDSLSAAKAALSATEVLLDEPERAMRAAQRRVADAALAVLTGEIAPAIATVERLRIEFAEALGGLHFLHSQTMGSPDGNLLKLHLRLPEIDPQRQNSGASRWAAYFDNLQRDASAPPPTI
jgi:hypothetical protein